MVWSRDWASYLFSGGFSVNPVPYIYTQIMPSSSTASSLSFVSHALYAHMYWGLYPFIGLFIHPCVRQNLFNSLSDWFYHAARAKNLWSRTLKFIETGWSKCKSNVCENPIKDSRGKKRIKFGHGERNGRTFGKASVACTGAQRQTRSGRQGDPLSPCSLSLTLSRLGDPSQATVKRRTNRH